MLHLPVLSHFRFLLPLTAVCHTAFTCYFTNTSNILLDVRHGPIFTPIKLLCVSCEDPLSSPSDCYASIFGSLWLLGFPVSKSECWDASQHSKVTSACFSFSPSDLNLLDPYFIFMYMHNNHCHRATAQLQLNILLLLFLLVTTVSISAWCSVIPRAPFPRSTAPVICASLLSCCVPGS